MANKAETEGAAPIETTAPVTDHDYSTDIRPLYEILPTGRKYKIWNSRYGLYYASPKIQLVMVAMVCFFCPGMFNALGGMGGGGKQDATLADNMVTRPPISS